MGALVHQRGGVLLRAAGSFDVVGVLWASPRPLGVRTANSDAASAASCLHFAIPRVSVTRLESLVLGAGDAKRVPASGRGTYGYFGTLREKIHRRTRESRVKNQ